MLDAILLVSLLGRIGDSPLPKLQPAAQQLQLVRDLEAQLEAADKLADARLRVRRIEADIADKTTELDRISKELPDRMYESFITAARGDQQAASAARAACWWSMPWRAFGRPSSRTSDGSPRAGLKFDKLRDALHNATGPTVIVDGKEYTADLARFETMKLQLQHDMARKSLLEDTRTADAMARRLEEQHKRLGIILEVRARAYDRFQMMRSLHDEIKAGHANDGAHDR